MGEAQAFLGARPGMEGALLKPSGYLGVQDQSRGPDAPSTHCEPWVPVCWADLDSRVKAGQERQSDWMLCRWSPPLLATLPATWVTQAQGFTGHS